MLQSAVGDSYVVDGAVYPRVTAILNIIHNQGLEDWRRKVGFAEADRISKEAAEFGTRLHHMVETFFSVVGFDEHHRCADELEPYREAFEKWSADHVDVCIATEKRVVHHGLRFAGTCDAVLKLKDGRIVVADWKSSNYVSATWPLQLVAYMAALSSQGEHIDGRIIVQMPSRSPGALEVHEYQQHAEDWADFKAALRLYRRFG